MRPRKVVIVYDALSVWADEMRYVLDLRHYRAYVAYTPEEMERYLLAPEKPSVVLALRGKESDRVLMDARGLGVETIEALHDPGVRPSVAARITHKGDVYDVLHQVRLAASRKRGPKAKPKELADV